MGVRREGLFQRWHAILLPHLRYTRCRLTSFACPTHPVTHVPRLHMLQYTTCPYRISSPPTTMPTTALSLYLHHSYLPPHTFLCTHHACYHHVLVVTRCVVGTFYHTTHLYHFVHPSPCLISPLCLVLDPGCLITTVLHPLSRERARGRVKLFTGFRRRMPATVAMTRHTTISTHLLTITALPSV